MKKGISLIVLVITIIIIIILAGAVILNLSNNNPIDNANKAAVLQEESDLNSGAVLWLAQLISDTSVKPAITFTADSELSDKIGTDGAALGAGYHDLANATVTKYVTDESGATVLGTGDTNVFTGYAGILGGVGMTPSKAAASGKEYKIAMNQYGSFAFYKDAPASGSGD